LNAACPPAQALPLSKAATDQRDALAVV
jgi:hypothetical protein